MPKGRGIEMETKELEMQCNVIFDGLKIGDIVTGSTAEKMMRDRSLDIFFEVARGVMLKATRDIVLITSVDHVIIAKADNVLFLRPM